MTEQVQTNGVHLQAQQARAVRHLLARTSGAQRAGLLLDIARRLETGSAAVLAANALDMAAAQASDMAPAMQDRLLLTAERVTAQVADLQRLASLPDPLAERYEQRVLDNGLKLCRQRVPLGVLGVIYESRPNVSIDVAALGLLSGNALVLRGGREARHSNRALLGLVHQALQAQGLPEALVQFVDRPERDSVLEMLDCAGSIDLLIPRGGAALQQLCLQRSRIPVVTGGIGICHLYVDASADLQRALPVIENAKVQRPTVCNALDCLLVHRNVAAELLPALHARLQPQGVSLRLDARAAELLAGYEDVLPAGTEDFDTEWLSLVLSVAVVDDVEQAVAHIQQHSSGHSDGILSETSVSIERFVAEVDSAAVYVNASTRFTDGAQFGLGAEVAVSTQRLHARGPMGLRELTTYKWLAVGDYHCRE